MTEQMARANFRKVYPENDIYITKVTPINDKHLLEVDFPDGTFYFIVYGNIVSQAYSTKERAMKEI